MFPSVKVNSKVMIISFGHILFDWIQTQQIVFVKQLRIKFEFIYGC